MKAFKKVIMTRLMAVALGLCMAEQSAPIHTRSHTQSGGRSSSAARSHVTPNGGGSVTPNGGGSSHGGGEVISGDISPEVQDIMKKSPDLIEAAKDTSIKNLIVQYIQPDAFNVNLMNNIASDGTNQAQKELVEFLHALSQSPQDEKSTNSKIRFMLLSLFYREYQGMGKIILALNDNELRRINDLFAVMQQGGSVDQSFFPALLALKTQSANQGDRGECLTIPSIVDFLLSNTTVNGNPENMKRVLQKVAQFLNEGSADPMIAIKTRNVLMQMNEVHSYYYGNIWSYFTSSKNLDTKYLSNSYGDPKYTTASYMS